MKDSKKKVLLVYPKIPVTYWSFRYALSLVGKKQNCPPLGLLTVAAMLSTNNYEVKLIDMNATPLTDEIILWADIIFTSAMIVQKASLAKLARKCKELNVPIVAGGPYPTSYFEEIENIDYFVLNEAEITLPQFLRDWKKGKPKRIYSDQTKPDISHSPAPRYDLLDINSYASMALQYSRGCPFNCEFCDITVMFGNKTRTKTSEQIINELNALYKLGWQGAVFFVDDNFIGNKKNVKSLLPNIIGWQKKHNYPFQFFTEASINLANDDVLLNLMKQAGFNMVFIGIETPVETTLLKTGKKQNAKVNLLESVKKIQKKGIEVTGGFIVGFDNDPSDIFDRQIDFIKNSGIVMAMMGILTALRGTKLYHRLKKEGRLLKESIGNNTHDLCLNFKTKMDSQTLINGYKYIISVIYSPKNYFNRCLTFLRNTKPHENSVRKVRKQEILAFLKSLLKQTFSSYGHHYLSYLFHSLITKPKMFPEAVRMAIQGHHFFKITNEILAVDKFKARAENVLILYKTKISDMRNYTEKTINDLKKLKEELIRKLQKEYWKIDKEFRYLTEETLDMLIKSLDASYNQWLEQNT